jgi:capsular polysaccharide biosynthesis protein/Mrp family chromosome partitioning ATPase
MRMPSEAPRGSNAVRVEQPVADWVRAAPPRGGLALYLDVLRSRLWFIVLMVALSILATAVVVATAEKAYKANADVLVTPIPGNNSSLFGFGLPSESGDPTRDVETLAQVIATPAVAARVRAELGVETSAQSLLSQVSVEPVAQSNIVTITAEASDPDFAAVLANEFGEAAIAERTERFHELLDAVIPRLRRQLAELPRGETAARDAVSTRLQDLETYRALDDPTLHLETRAVPPPSASSPRTVLSIAASFVAALVLGVGGVLGLHLLDTRIIREEDLRGYRIPILARIPLETPRGRRPRVAPSHLSAGTMDAFRRLGSALAARSDGHAKQTIFVTGASPSDGKTTTSLNLARSLAMMNERVVLIEADARQPSLSRVLGLMPAYDVSDVLGGRSSLVDALEPADGLNPGLRVLFQRQRDRSVAPHISSNAADALIRDAELAADWVIFDGPALNYAPDALPLAKRANSILLVIRMRKTRVSELSDLAELLSQQGITPDGFVLVGGKAQPAYY